MSARAVRSALQVGCVYIYIATTTKVVVPPSLLHTCATPPPSTAGLERSTYPSMVVIGRADAGLCQTCARATQLSTLVYRECDVETSIKKVVYLHKEDVSRRGYQTWARGNCIQLAALANHIHVSARPTAPVGRLDVTHHVTLGAISTKLPLLPLRRVETCRNSRQPVGLSPIWMQ